MVWRAILMQPKEHSIRRGQAGAEPRTLRELLVKFALMPPSWHKLALEIGFCFLRSLIQTWQSSPLSKCCFAVSCTAETFHIESWVSTIKKRYSGEYEDQ